MKKSFLPSAVTKLWYELGRYYALWRIGATHDESYSWNTTDRILLTFDDFGTPETIDSILATLKKENVRAAFFLCGNWTDANPDQVKKIADQGHWIGNHSYSHPNLLELTDEQVTEELTKGLQTKLMRPPYGAYNDRIRTIASGLGFKIGFWTIDSWDWKGLNADEMQEMIFPRLHKGGCILLHLNAPHTAEALPALITGIRERGYELCHDGTEIQA